MMRSIIKNLLREMASTNLKRELIAMGPQNAREELGISLEDFVTIVYDNDIVDYVSNYIPELTDLTRYNDNVYDYNGKGPLSGLVFKYVGKYKTKMGNIISPHAVIPRSKLLHLELLTQEMLIEFINEFYDLNVTRIVPMKETNFG